MIDYHYTTLSVHYSTMDLIASISLLTGLSKNEIILMTLNRLSRECRGSMPRHFKQVKYQRRDKGGYMPLPLKLPVDAYEYFKDIRHVLRGSAALLLAIALRMYYDLFLDGMMDDAVFMPHSFVGFFLNDQQLWIQHWGELPKEVAQKLRYFYNYLPILE